MNDTKTTQTEKTELTPDQESIAENTEPNFLFVYKMLAIRWMIDFLCATVALFVSDCVVDEEKFRNAAVPTTELFAAPIVYLLLDFCITILYCSTKEAKGMGYKFTFSELMFMLVYYIIVPILFYFSVVPIVGRMVAIFTYSDEVILMFLIPTLFFGISANSYLAYWLCFSAVCVRKGNKKQRH